MRKRAFESAKGAFGTAQKHALIAAGLSENDA
jgi:hypothetical protein